MGESKKDHFEDVKVILEGLDEGDINSLLKKYNEVNLVRKKLEQLEDMLKLKVKIHLKERKWDRYLDPETKISVSIDKQSRETINKERVKELLNEAQYAQVLRVSTFEKVSIVDKETRARLRNYVKKENI